MKIRVLVTIVTAATIAIFACSQKKVAEAGEPVTNSQTSNSDNTAAAVALPTFSMLDSKGNAVHLQSLKGKKVFLNLWASWCPPCRREMPSIERLYKSIDTTKVAFVMLSLDDSFDKAKAFAKRQKLSVPSYYPTENLPSLFNVQSIPTTFIFDERGELIQRIDGGDDYDTKEYKTLLQ